METKVCSICGDEKNISNFHKRKHSKDGLRSDCKSCTRLRINEYRKLNKEKVNKLNRETYLRRIDAHKKTQKNYREQNKELEKDRRKKYRENNLGKIKKYYQDNKLKLSKQSLERITKRRKTDKLFGLVCTIRTRVYNFLKSKNITKNNKTFDIVGCSPEFLKEHIEKQFTDGMSWDLMGEHIHIDHIIPLSSANTEDEVYKLCHYTNLQPLWAKDNLKKSNKII